MRDYGTLLDLTGHIDVNLVGFAGNVVMAAMSNPIAGGTVSDSGGHVAGTVSSGGGGGGGAGAARNLGAGGAGGGGGGGGGKLPFTGYPVVLLAAVGAMLGSAGAVLRSLVRRKS